VPPLLLLAPVGAQSLSSVLVAEGLGRPTDVRFPPGDDERIFVTAAQDGIHIIKNGQLLPELFLEFPQGFLQNPEGLMTMAFHPEYQVNGKFYVTFLDAGLTEHFMEFTVSAANPDLADRASGVYIVPPFQQPSPLHNWNNLIFGPDGMLYVFTGIGVGNNHPDSFGQDLSSLDGKILRFDIDLPAPHVPPDNPFVGVAGARDEIWVYGFREPWRGSFDRETGDMYIGDVGLGEIEEVDFIPAGHPGGLNFGWRCMQGTLCMMYAGCQPLCDAPDWVPPIYEYAHETTLSAVIGGYVYRGDDIPGLQGSYFFSDNREGRTFSFRYDGSRVTGFQERTSELLPPTLSRTTTFGEDNDGELYFANLAGELWKIVAADACPGATSYCTATPNSAGGAARISSSGTTSVAANDFVLCVSRAVPYSFGLFYYGDAQAQTPFGDGFNCVGGHIFRLDPPSAIGPSGVAVRLVDLTSPPEVDGTITAGSRWNFQFWFRDPDSPGASFNTTDGSSALFCP